MICYQPTHADGNEHAPRGIWSLVLDSFRRRNRRNHLDDNDNDSVAIVELDHVRDRKANEPPGR